MKKVFLLSVAAAVLFGHSAMAETVSDGFEGPFDFPPFTFDFETDGVGFDADWFVDNVVWVGDNQFQMTTDSEIKTEGDVSQKVNSAVNDGNIRDLYLARFVDNVEAGMEYQVSLDYRYDQYVDPSELSNHIQIDIRDGDHRSRDAVADIEDFSGHERPDTLFVNAETFGTGEFSTVTLSHTPAAGESSFTFLAIVRFHSPDLEENWVWLDNFIATDEIETEVQDWDLY